MSSTAWRINTKVASGSQVIQTQTEVTLLFCKYFPKSEISCRNSQNKNLPEEIYYKTYIYKEPILQVLSQHLKHSIPMATLYVL